MTKKNSHETQFFRHCLTRRLEGYAVRPEVFRTACQTLPVIHQLRLRQVLPDFTPALYPPRVVPHIITVEVYTSSLCGGRHGRLLPLCPDSLSIP